MSEPAADYIGPCAIDCDLRCPLPAGARLSLVPRPRHAWSDVLCCPNCDRAFLVIPPDAPEPEAGGLLK